MASECNQSSGNLSPLAGSTVTSLCPVCGKQGEMLHDSHICRQCKVKNFKFQCEYCFANLTTSEMLSHLKTCSIRHEDMINQYKNEKKGDMENCKSNNSSLLTEYVKIEVYGEDCDNSVSNQTLSVQGFCETRDAQCSNNFTYPGKSIKQNNYGESNTPNSQTKVDKAKTFAQTQSISDDHLILCRSNLKELIQKHDRKLQCMKTTEDQYCVTLKKALSDYTCSPEKHMILQTEKARLYSIQKRPNLEKQSSCESSSSTSSTDDQTCHEVNEESSVSNGCHNFCLEDQFHEMHDSDDEQRKALEHTEPFEEETIPYMQSECENSVEECQSTFEEDVSNETEVSETDTSNNSGYEEIELNENLEEVIVSSNNKANVNTGDSKNEMKNCQTDTCKISKSNKKLDKNSVGDLIRQKNRKVKSETAIIPYVAVMDSDENSSDSFMNLGDTVVPEEEFSSNKEGLLVSQITQSKEIENCHRLQEKRVEQWVLDNAIFFKKSHSNSDSDSKIDGKRHKRKDQIITNFSVSILKEREHIHGKNTGDNPSVVENEVSARKFENEVVFERAIADGSAIQADFHQRALHKNILVAEGGIKRLGRTQENRARKFCQTGHGMKNRYASDFSSDVQEQKSAIEEIYTCSVCDYYFSNMMALKKHMRMHVQKKEDQIPLIDSHESLVAECSTQSQIANVSISINSIESGEEFVCGICKLNASSIEELTQHMQSHAQLIYQFVCNQCEHAFSSLDALRFHMHMHRKPQEQFLCGLCSLTFSSVINLKHHMKTHSHLEIIDKKSSVHMDTTIPKQDSFSQATIPRRSNVFVTVNSNDMIKKQTQNKQENKASVVSKLLRYKPPVPLFD